MRKLFEFIRRIYVVVLFVALEGAAISYYAHSTHYTQARLLARSNQVAGGVHGFFAGIRRYFSLGHENRLLLGRVAQLEERLAQYEEAETNARLDSYMQDIGESKYRFVTASVVANTVNRAQNLITLNRGLRDGVQPEMGLVSPAGAMVGYVLDCSDRYAVAMSVLNTSFRASGEVAGDGHFGSIYWDGCDAEHVRMRDLSKYAAVERGDTIISTSFSRYFPAGILIGTVEEFELNETRTAYDVRIRLAADMTALHDVVLVKNQDYNEQRQLEEGI